MIQAAKIRGIHLAITGLIGVVFGALILVFARNLYLKAQLFSNSLSGFAF